MKKIVFYLALVCLTSSAADAQIIFTRPSVSISPSGTIEDVLSDEVNPPAFLAKITNRPKAQHTDTAIEKRVTGRVILKVVLNANGNVTDIEVVEKLPDGLTENAIAAARKIKFEPALEHGKPVSMRVKLIFKFSYLKKELSSKEIKNILHDEQPWLGERSQIFLANQLQRIERLSYYDAIRFAPELIKKGRDFLAPSEQTEYQLLWAKMMQSLGAEDNAILQAFPFFSGQEVIAEDRQKSDAVVRKGWSKLSATDQQRWRELHDKVVEFSLFPPHAN